MASKCFNRNSAAYKALEAKYISKLKVDSYIDNYQRLTKSDDIPTVTKVESMLEKKKALYSLKKRKYKTALLANLSRRKVINKNKGEYWVNHSNPNTRKYSKKVLIDNIESISKYLDFNNLPNDLIKYRSVGSASNIQPGTPGYFRSYIISINDSMITEDVIKQTNNKNATHITGFIGQLQRTFPNLTVDIVSVSEAKEHYKSLPASQKLNVPFEKINGYFVNGNVKLIEGKVTSEMAIEEMLHPFTDSLYIGNRKLFNNILAEARKMFPQLKQQIDDAYMTSRGFNQKHRDLELVTQALSRHFKKEYEENPTRNWRDVIQDLLKWFLKLADNLSQYITGNKLRIPVNVIKSNTNLSDIAKLLNIEDLEIYTGETFDGKVRYSLAPETKKVIDYVKSTANQTQKDVIDNMFRVIKKEDKEVNQLTTDNIILERDSHTYFNLDTGETYTSATTAIKGKLDDPQGDYELNRLIGNDYDAILEGIAMGQTFEELPKMEVLKPKVAQEAYKQLNNMMLGMRALGNVVIPQVIVSDKTAGIAGMVDILVIKPDGSLTIIDLKASKNHMTSDRYMKEMYPVNEGSIFYDSSKPKDQQMKMTTKMQHGIQVGLYRRMLENMGYKVDTEISTFHILVGVTGIKKKQKFSGAFELTGSTFHMPSENARYVNQIVPLNINKESKDRLTEIYDKNGTLTPSDIMNEDESDQHPESDAPSNEAYDSMFKGVIGFKGAVINVKEAISKLRNSTLFDVSNLEYIEELEQTVSSINVAILRGTVDVVYSEILMNSIKSIDKFIDYLTDPKNFDKDEYIKRVLYWNRFVQAYQGLVNISNADGLNKTQLKLKEKLATKLNELTGQNKNDKGDVESGLLENAIENYTMSWIGQKTNRPDITQEDLKHMVRFAEDIGWGGFIGGDIDTSSDTILALMAKEFKSTKQRMLDKIQTRGLEIRDSASKLLSASPTNTVDYSFMQTIDENGEWTGRYVKEIGYQYYRKLDELADNLRNSDGVPIQYIEKDNLDDYTPEEIEHNKKLYIARQKYSEFMRAENKSDKGVIDGNYHKYTDEFKAARDKILIYKPSIRDWVRKGGVSDIQWENFKTKYYDDIVYDRAIKDGNNDFTGMIKRDTFSAVKRDHVEPREISADGQDMRDSKYIAIMNPTNDLEQAQKEFYLMFRRVYEEELLPMLPKNIEQLMQGKSPVVKDRFLSTLESKPDIVAQLWTKFTRGWKNYWQTTSTQEIIAYDEFGNLVEDTLPIYYVGKTRDENELKKIQAEIDVKTKRLSNVTSVVEEDKLKERIKELRGQRQRLQTQPSKGEMSKDMADNLLRFTGMAQNYESLTEVEDTFKALMHILAKRKYTPRGGNIITRTWRKGKKYVEEKTGIRGTGSNRGEAKILSRARKWMRMTFYENEKRSLRWYDKVARSLINFSSLGYVGFNVFGNFNNYLIGRINNGIEASGALYFDTKAYARATALFNGRAVPDIFNKWAHNFEESFGKGQYKEYRTRSKYESLVELYRMIDPKSAIRETVETRGREGRTMRIINSVGYSLQDAGEYNVQTKTGMAILLSLEAINSETGETISLYDAYQFNTKTGKTDLKKGFDKVRLRNGKEINLDDNARYEIRNYIREVNKQIHGNYAYEDRMLIQAYTIGQLAAQFHKWVVPAIKARWRKEYFDENLGWIEGRYISLAKFVAYATKNIGQINKLKTNFKAFHGAKGEMKYRNAMRSLGEIGIFLLIYQMQALLLATIDDEEDERSATRRKLDNMMIYYTDRLQKEMLMFLPTGSREQMQMITNPIPTTRTIGELSEAMQETLKWVPNLPAYYGMDENSLEYEQWKLDSGLFYKRGSRKGQPRLGKEWSDAIPILYTINRWKAFDNIRNFYIK